MSKYWVTNYAGLYSEYPKRLMYLPVGAVVERLEAYETFPVNGVDRWFVSVEYTYELSGKMQTVRGWIYTGYLETLYHEYPAGVIKIDTATLNPNDANQFNIYGGLIQHNLCGPLSVAFVTGWNEDINWLLDQWKAKAPSAWARVFPGYRGHGTDLGDLDSMLSSFEGYDLPARRFPAALYEPVKGGPLLTPGRLRDMLIGNYVIASCHIDGNTGRLRGSGVLHWVVLTDVLPDGIGRGWVTLYNPYPNRIERYSWDEWRASAGEPYGIVVPRK